MQADKVDWSAVNIALTDLSEACHSNMVQKGFWDESRNMGEIIALIHSEASEALEEHRQGHPLTAIRLEGPLDKPEGFPIELADIILRIMDIVGGYHINLAEAIKMKMRYNETRPHKHMKKY